MSSTASTAPTDPQRVADFWSTKRNDRRPTGWMDHHTIQAWLHRRITGNPSLSTVAWWKQQYFPEAVGCALSLGCGFGELDRNLIALGIAEHVQAVDIAAGAVEQARATATAAGLGDRIDYRVANLDEIELAPSAFDAIFASSSFHHVVRLEHLFGQCRRALRPGALLFLDDYVGPSRFQSGPQVFDLMNRVVALLPERYRRNLFTDDGALVERITPQALDYFASHDPSEAIRSAEIIPALTRDFEIVEHRPYGGALLHLLLSGIVGNFDETCERDTMFLTLLATMEHTLEEHGILDSDFAVIVARPRGGDGAADSPKPLTAASADTRPSGRIQTDPLPGTQRP